MKYMRKTPVEAIQWTGHNAKEVYEFINNAANVCCIPDNESGSLVVVGKDHRGRKFKAIIPELGWVVREGKTFQYYKNITFHCNFEKVTDDDTKGIDWECMNKTIKEAFDGFDEVFKGFKDVFGAAPIKEASDDAIRTSIQINPDGRLTIDDLYKDDEKTREEIKKNLSEGLKEMENSDKTKGTEIDTFESVLDEMKELHAKKDKDYNESFHNLFKEYGMSYALGHIEEKLNRVKAIIANGGNAVKNEHIEDSLIDGACYNILTLIELRNRKH